MRLVPWRFRNIINPWQTPREIRAAVRYLERLVKGLSDEDRARLTREHDEDRRW